MPRYSTGYTSTGYTAIYEVTGEVEAANQDAAFAAVRDGCDDLVDVSFEQPHPDTEFVVTELPDGA